MNQAQETHVKSMASKIEMHADAIKRRMQALQRNSLLDMPTELTEMNFREVTSSCEAMQHVLDDMLPRMPQ